MKIRVITAVALLVISIGAAIFCVHHLNNITGRLERQLESAMQNAASDTPGWEQSATEIQRDWERHKDFLHTLLPHMNLNELEWTLGALPAYAEQHEKTLFLEQCVRGLQCVRTVREMERPSWGNIF